MRKSLLSIALIGFVGLANGQEIQNPVVKKLYEKGIITKEEAVQLDNEVGKEKKKSIENEKKVERIEKELKKSKNKLVGKFKKVKYSGVGYIGYTFIDRKNGKDEGRFEIRRGYSIIKTYFNDKDYFRVTFDITNFPHKNDPNQGNEFDVKFKHLYIYKDISTIIPETGFEFGIVHTPWLDFEEHSGWWFRSVSKTFYEASDGAHLLPSADLGVDFKTKTEKFSAEYGIFEGEGYDHIGRSDKGDKPRSPSIEARLTWHIYGGGTLRYIRGHGKVPKLNPRKDTYTNISIHGLNSFNHRGSDDDLTVYQIHAVYNQPSFLVAGQYIKSDWYTGSENTGDGYSFNFEIRPSEDKKASLFGRYDHWNSDNNSKDRDMYIYGLAYKMTNHLTWIVNGIKTDYKNDNSKDYNKYMITADVEF
jgi:polyhydroxyalkanoate synthesis regulator phasin